MDEEQERQLKARLNKAKKARKKRAKAKKQAGGADSTPEVDAAATATAAPGVDIKRVQTGQSGPRHPRNAEENEDNLDFEDPFEDVYEEEADAVDAAAEEEEDEEGDATMKEEDNDDDEEEDAGPVYYYAPSKNAEEELEVDPSAYGMLHQMKFDWPALSFDFFVDHTGHERTKFPMSMWFVAGTQADSAVANELNLIKLSNLHRTKDSEEDDGAVIMEGDVEEEGDPIMEHRTLEHKDGSVNRVRAMPQQPGVIASWGESGKVCLYDARKFLQGLDLDIVSGNVGMSQRTTPVYTMAKHKSEGYGLDWSRCRPGRLASGDQGKEIYIWDVGAGGTVAIDPQPFKGHQGSIEDLQWSPTEENVLASCSTDGTVRIWDMRVRNRAMLTQQAHDQDVNVISWNPKVSYLLASGSDDCSFKVWDLRQFSGSAQAAPVGWFKGFHTDSITSIEWSPHDESVIACASADHQTTVWDLALEEDREYARQAADKGFAEDVLDENGRPIQFPPQLLFIHAGVRDPKELHFHPQAVGVIGVTGDSGIDVFLCEPLDPKSQLARD